MYVRNLTGEEFPLQAATTNEMELNGNQSISATIYPTKVNNAFINDITELWVVGDLDGVEHKIIYAKKKGEGDRLTVEVKAIPLFFDTFDTERIYDEYNEHMTAMRCFTLIFEDSGYNFVLVDSFDAIEWEGLGGGETRLEMFKRALNRYGAEFRISGNTIYLHKQVGRDTQFQYRYRLNASNIVQENDATAMWTYAKGYGDYEEGDEEGGGGWENANLVREYTSPLAKIPQIGIRHAPPIKDGRISDKTTMDKALKELVDESLKISVSADIHDLRRQGYQLAQPELGDRVFLIDERIGLDEEVRVVDIKIMRNWKGEVLDLQLTFGSEGLTKRHQSNLKTAIKDITDIMAGRKKIPFSAYDAAVINATNKLKGITSQLTVPENGGLMAIDKNNPNNIVLFNAAGIGISNDGGATFKTAMTGDGVVAETIIGNHIIGVNLSSIDETGYFHVNGSNAEFVNTSNNRRVTISPDGLYGYNANNSIRFQADEVLVTSRAMGTSTANIYLAAQNGKEGRIVDIADVPSDGEVESYTYLPFRAYGFYGNFVEVNRGVAGTNLYLRPRQGGEVRVTGANTTDVYYPLRASNIFGSSFITTTTSAWIGTDSALHVVNKGYADGGAGSPIYRDVFAANMYNSAMITRSTNAYIGVDGELKVVNKGLGEIYRDVRALGFIGNRVGLGTHISGATNFHVQTAGNGEVQITDRSGGGSFRPIRAREFITDTSVRENKKNIDIYDVDVLPTIRTAEAYLYNRATDPSYTKKQLGLMLDEMPYETYSERGDGFGVYGLIAFLFRGLKQTLDEVDRLKEAK